MAQVGGGGGPCTHMGDMDGAPGSWLQIAPASGVGQVGHEPAEGGAHTLSGSDFQINKMFLLKRATVGRPVSSDLDQSGHTWPWLRGPGTIQKASCTLPCGLDNNHTVPYCDTCLPKSGWRFVAIPDNDHV